MTTAPILKFVCGSRSLDLNDGTRFALEPDFIPPAMALDVQMSGGPSANVYNGAVKVYQRGQNTQFSFTVQVLGSSERAVNAAFKDLEVFTALAGVDTNVPLYLEYKPNSDTPKPVWGQDGWLRYEVRHAPRPQIGTRYGQGEYRARNVTALVNVDLAPYPEGLKQQACTATGGIIEDNLGYADGLSRGLIIPPAGTNLITNPSLETNITGYSDSGANVTLAQSSDVALFGSYSLKITSSVATREYIIVPATTVNGTTYTLSCYARMSDGSAVSGSNIDAFISNTAAASVSVQSIGNGWYKVTSASVTAGADTSTHGFGVIHAGVMYIDGVNLTATAYGTPPIDGDMLGCAWTGTAHASTSTRTAASCKLTTGSDNLSPGAGTINVIWKTHVANTHPNDMYIFSAGATSLLAYFKASDDKFYFTDGTNTVSSAAQTFAAGDTLVLDFVWASGQLAIYKNGASIASGATYTPPALGAYLFLGTDASGANNSLATFTATTFGSALTSTQIGNNYTNISAAITNGEKIGSIPWFWTDDGDNVLSLSVGKQALGVVGGVPGSAPAITEIQGTLSSNWSTVKSILLSNFASDIYLSWATFWYDTSGTVSVTGPSTTLASYNILARYRSYFENKEYALFARFQSGYDIYLYTGAYNGLGGGSESPKRVITAYATNRLYRTRPYTIGWNTSRFTGYLNDDLSIVLVADKKDTNSSVVMDWVAFVPRPHVMLSGGTVAHAKFSYKGSVANQILNTSYVGKALNVTGDVVEFVPNKLNHFQCYFCPDETVDPASTYTATFDAIYLTPRFALL